MLLCSLGSHFSLHIVLSLLLDHYYFPSDCWHAVEKLSWIFQSRAFFKKKKRGASREFYGRLAVLSFLKWSTYLKSFLWEELCPRVLHGSFKGFLSVSNLWTIQCSMEPKDCHRNSTALRWLGLQYREFAPSGCSQKLFLLDLAISSYFVLASWWFTWAPERLPGIRCASVCLLMPRIPLLCRNCSVGALQALNDKH